MIYGKPSDLSSHYKRITKQYHHPVIIGKEFWHRLTGDEDFYVDLLNAIGSVAVEADYSKEFERIVNELASKEAIKNLK